MFNLNLFSTSITKTQHELYKHNTFNQELNYKPNKVALHIFNIKYGNFLI